jgi:hypothetical protein
MASSIAFHNNYHSIKDAFFSRPHASNPNGVRTNLMTEDIGRMAKAIAVSEGLDPTLFSAKSFKIGFVSQLDAAGATPEQRAASARPLSPDLDPDDPFRDFDIPRDAGFCYDSQDALPDLTAELSDDQASEPLTPTKPATPAPSPARSAPKRKSRQPPPSDRVTRRTRVATKPSAMPALAAGGDPSRRGVPSHTRQR